MIFFIQQFKFTTKVDRILLVTGILFSLIAGACFPILGLFFGGMTNIFINQAVQVRTEFCTMIFIKIRRITFA